MHACPEPDVPYDAPRRSRSARRRRKRRSLLPKLFAAGVLLGAAIFFLPRIYNGLWPGHDIPQSLTNELQTLAESRPEAQPLLDHPGRYPEALLELAVRNPEALDFVLGSLHNWVGAEENIDFYYTDFSGGLAQCRRALENALDSTWALVTDCPDCYDSLAHIVYPLRYMARDGQALSLADYEERVRDIFTQVARTDHALEVNTNRGQDLEVWPQVLGWFRDCGGRYVTIGSDAHRPQDVAAGIREGTELVRQAGFAGVTTYVRRRPVIHPF